MVAMAADPEKHRNGMDVVFRAERKCLFAFGPASQLNSRQLVGCNWSFGCIPLACSTPASYIEPTCDTKHGSQHMPRSAYRIYFVSIQTPLLDFFDAHSHHFRDIVTGLKIHHGDTKYQV